MSRKRQVTTAWLVVAVGLWALPAAAQRPPSIPELEKSQAREWARGVPLQEQEAARKLFLEGNELLRDSVFVEATQKYAEALKHWDNPAIHYNLSLALINLNRPLELYAHLEAAMRYGVGPLDEQKYEFVRSYQALVRKQLVDMVITCDKQGARVEMDGRYLFTGPGKHQELILPGQHKIVATLEGYEATDKGRLFQAGEEVKVDLRLYTKKELTRYRQVWAPWIPWLVTGAGAVVAAGGGGLQVLARDNFRTFDDTVAAECVDNCAPIPGPSDRLNSGNLQQTAALGAYAAGGAALLTGVALLFINRPEAYTITAVEHEKELQDKAPAGVSITPVLGTGMGGAVATFRF